MSFGPLIKGISDAYPVPTHGLWPRYGCWHRQFPKKECQIWKNSRIWVFLVFFSAFYLTIQNFVTESAHRGWWPRAVRKISRSIDAVLRELGALVGDVGQYQDEIIVATGTGLDITKFLSLIIAVIIWGIGRLMQTILWDWTPWTLS